MKKLVVLVFLALSLLAARTTIQVDNPFPQCDPCQWVR